MPSRLARVAAIVCIAIAGTACSKTLDTGGLEPQLASQLNTKLSTSGTSVSCPTGIKIESGATFDCTATLASGDTLTIRVTQNDDQGHVTWKVVQASPSS